LPVLRPRAPVKKARTLARGSFVARSAKGLTVSARATSLGRRKLRKGLPVRSIVRARDAAGTRASVAESHSVRR
jgi:hypothetical protein